MPQNLQDVITELAMIKSEFLLMKERFLVVNERYAKNMESLNALTLHAAEAAKRAAEAAEHAKETTRQCADLALKHAASPVRRERRSMRLQKPRGSRRPPPARSAATRAEYACQEAHAHPSWMRRGVPYRRASVGDGVKREAGASL